VAAVYHFASTPNIIMQHIDLDNFEQPQFQAAPYILTSPRSLRACAKHAIRPVDLLPRSVEDFERMYAPLGYSAQQVRAETILHEERRQGEIDFVVVFLSSLAKPAVAVALSSLRSCRYYETRRTMR
jgi:hypothetical protein